MNQSAEERHSHPSCSTYGKICQPLEGGISEQCYFWFQMQAGIWECRYR